MITPKQFASQNAVWHTLVPTLEQFTRWVNASIRGGDGTQPPSVSETQRRALIAEIAFESASQNLSVDDISLQADAMNRLTQLPGAGDIGGPLAKEELRETQALREYLTHFLHNFTAGVPDFRYQLQGCGAVQSAEVDIVVASHFIEVKAVERGFRSSDFRQLLTYAAIAYSSGRQVERISLVNPRLRRHYTCPAEDLALDIGAGSWVDLMQDLVTSMVEDLDVSGV